jgi:hypothetical protein
VKANDSKMSRPEVEKFGLEWICSFCENNVCSAVQCSADWISMMGLESGLGKIASDPFFHRILYNSSKRKRSAKKIISRKSAATTTKSWNYLIQNALELI